MSVIASPSIIDLLPDNDDVYSDCFVEVIGKNKTIKGNLVFFNAKYKREHRQNPREEAHQKQTIIGFDVGISLPIDNQILQDALGLNDIIKMILHMPDNSSVLYDIPVPKLNCSKQICLDHSVEIKQDHILLSFSILEQ